ncbi:MAG: methyltransferase [Candidatus Omnitrophota bacterium]
MIAHRSHGNDDLQLNDIMETALSFQKSRVLLTAYELGVFTALGEKSKSSAEVANALGAAERATDRLMNALCSMSFLEKKGDRFSNTPLTSKFFVEGKPDFSRGFMHFVQTWDTWSTLTEAVRQGKSVIGEKLDEHSKEWFEPFIALMHEHTLEQAPAVVALLDIPEGLRLLDVGGGSGGYSMAFVRAKKGATAVVFDLPKVTPLAENYIAEAGLSDKIKTKTGDYKVTDFGSGFDLVFLSAIIHINSVEENRKLIKKSAQALNPGGQVVIQDFIMDENRISPPFNALFALTMLVATESGDTYTESEVRTWMEEAGLSNIIRKDTGFDSSLIIGKKA